MLLAMAACTTEEVVMVSVASIQVVPEEVSAVEGDQVQLAATVRDDRNEQLSPSGVEWSSDDPQIASVDARGLVEAHAAGSVRVRASYRGVSGATNVRVFRGPFVDVARSTVGMYTAPGASPEPETVSVTNGGAGELTQLAAAVQYEGQANGWLSAELDGTSAPTQLTLTAAPEGLSSGMYEADVRLSSADASGPTSVRVTLSVAGFEVRETDGRTAVREGGATDDVAVRLSARPNAGVVLSVSSSDPGEVSVNPGSLRFTPSDWDSPQTITVRGAPDGVDDGDQSVSVIVSVDVGQSHDAFEGLADQTVTVVNADEDAPVATRIVVAETGPDTRVGEEGTYDSIRVRLSAPPASNVVLSASSANPSEVAITSASTLVFTPANWGSAQLVVVRGVDDVADDGNRNVVVGIAVVDAASADAYDGRAANVTVRNMDNDRGGGRGGGDGGDDDDDDDDDEDDDDNSGPGGGGGGRRGRGG